MIHVNESFPRHPSSCSYTSTQLVTFHMKKITLTNPHLCTAWHNFPLTWAFYWISAFVYFVLVSLKTDGSTQIYIPRSHSEILLFLLLHNSSLLPKYFVLKCSVPILLCLNGTMKISYINYQIYITSLYNSISHRNKMPSLIFQTSIKSNSVLFLVYSNYRYVTTEEI